MESKVNAKIEYKNFSPSSSVNQCLMMLMSRVTEVAPRGAFRKIAVAKLSFGFRATIETASHHWKVFVYAKGDDISEVVTNVEQKFLNQMKDFRFKSTSLASTLDRSSEYS